MTLYCTLTTEPAEDALRCSDVLTVQEFDAPARWDSTDPRHFITGLPGLDRPARREVWRSSSSIATGSDGVVGWAAAKDELFAATVMDVPLGQDVESAAYDGWRRLLDVSVAHGCPHIVRSWNHIPHINAGLGDGERYKRFCVGRQRAFQARDFDARRYPAATAVGHRGNALAICLLARAEPGHHFENPRQVSAYRYPRCYGPMSPSFARATLVTWPRCSTVFVSGTASIIGHRSANAGDVEGQLDVTIHNIDQLLRTIAASGDCADTIRLDALRVYVRDAAHLPRIQSVVEARFGTNRAAYVRADICRSELAVEIEGVCHALPPAGAPPIGDPGSGRG